MQKFYKGPDPWNDVQMEGIMQDENGDTHFGWSERHRYRSEIQSSIITSMRRRIFGLS